MAPRSRSLLHALLLLAALAGYAKSFGLPRARLA